MNKSDITSMTNELKQIKGITIIPKNINYIPEDAQVPKGKTVLNLNCSIMFVDMRNSTFMTDSNGRKNMVKIYKMFTRLVVKSVEENFGQVMQIVGDGMLCLFINKIIDNNIYNSGQLAMDSVRSINTYLKESYNPIVDEAWEIKVGMGICTGHVYLNKLGKKGKDEVCQVAYPSSMTNYASKFCNNARAGEVIFDDNTYNHIDEYDREDVETKTLPQYGEVNCLRDITWTIEN